jgi:hypothetical protein
MAGNYSVTVYNPNSSVTSVSAALTVTPSISPVIITPPVGFQTVGVGARVTLSVEAGGTAPLSYLWYFNGAQIGGATGASLLLTNVTLSDAGTYTVVVSNSFGTTMNNGAVVNVITGEAGGTVNFNNRVVGDVTAPIYDVDGHTGLSGPAFLAQLYAGLTASDLRPIGAAVPFRIGAAAGFFDGSVRTITTVPGGQIAILQVRAWESRSGTSFEQAFATGGKTGSSELFSLVTGNLITDNNPPTFPVNLVGLQSFSLSTPQIVPTSTEARLEISSDGLTLIGNAESCCIEVSTDLVTWTILRKVEAAGVSRVIDTEAAKHPQRFYRVRPMTH